MKVIFLDIDGVLNMYGASCRTFMKPYGQHIEPHLVQRLNYIVEQTKCKIVISSSWRGDMQDLEKQLREQGFKYWTSVIGRTCKPTEKEPNMPFPRTNDNYLYNYRGEQIKKWLDDTNFSISKYVVIDDEVSDICGEKCSIIPEEYVQSINGYEGMLNKDAVSIVNNLKG